MGEFDCYCLLCSGPLVPCDIGSTSRARLTQRRRRIAKKLLAIEEGRSFDSFASDSDEEAGHDSESDCQEGDGDGEVWEQDERRSYDPDVAGNELVGWVEDIRVLGVDGGGRAFVSGRANYDDAGLIYVEQGDDPNQPSISEKPYYDCYVPSNDNEVVFPFHTHCMLVFEEAFKWSCTHSRRGKESLDLTTLYKTATRIGSLTNLNLDYGGISGVDQCWECIPGEEYSVIDPLRFSLDALDFIYKWPSAANPSQPTGSKAKGTETEKVIIDPFNSLPIEILHLICGHLPADALQYFLAASVTAYYATKNESFWKALCLERVPWAWEVWRDIDGDGEKEVVDTKQGKGKVGVNYKKLFFCLERNTEQKFGLGVENRGWLGLVNRRRIWDVCVRVSGEYWEDRKGVDG
ncbi:uncharacterized protein N7496_012607 [Penicillium cataractarum]|uniref:F-box domain-containing protein n=1 Tax=Penicillium cataractarum TaxID=2100454 RepID=A0A9W9R9C7_9EURO|nr:uncharacterized protein N7496_012607 [Penicillium cataractarum]KAJ5355395.1 hypothetical protein N7496_012607 [Penicillium cataractarum]